MSNYAIVKIGVVANVIVWDGNKNVQSGGWEPPSGTTAVPLEPSTFVCIGYAYDGTKFSPPAEVAA
ncbi:hypothetical protein [Burkholderia sp. Ac-20344]|uniref:hypothetical protein n=1 Tax=Burkholderia sp. Ac-20344 TaxID=2703890 RepID=UPI00197C365A|nr:hypothetical protein [Burkholderia sp. Ac-20344]MBN3832975.1 hypothetical protein [Burkholderia sp. Ac-20344]